MKLNYKNTCFTALGFTSIMCFWALYDAVIPLILKTSFDMGDTITGGIMALDNILALFLLPLFGGISDRTHTRFGKRKPFVVAGTAATVVFMMLLPPMSAQRNLIGFLAMLGLLLLSMGTYRSPAVALMPDITPKHLRSRANSIINFIASIGHLYALLAIKFLFPGEGSENYFPLFIAVAAFMVICVAVMSVTINENKLAKEAHAIDEMNSAPEETKEVQNTTKERMPKAVRLSFIMILLTVFFCYMAFNALSTAYSRYASVVWGMSDGSFADALIVVMVAAGICFVPIGILAGKFGRKKLIIIGTIMVTLTYFAGIFIDEYSPIVTVIFIFTGIGWAAINVNTYPMVVEMSKESDVGKYTGYYYTFSMAAQVFTPVLSGFFLEHISYRTLFPYATIFSILSIITILFVKHGDSKPIVTKDTIAEMTSDIGD